MSDIERELLHRYLSGNASAEECERVEAWLAQDPRRWAQLAAEQSAIADVELSEGTVDEAKVEVWSRLAAHIGTEDMVAASRGRSRRAAREFPLQDRRRKWVPGQLAAALVMLMVGGGLAATILLRRQPVPAALRIATTAPAERATFRLPDGTQVMLGVASIIKYPVAFPDDRREVLLVGEAYFDVVHEHDRGFIVRAGDLIAKDVGTQFTVRAYADDPDARVVVRQGKVAIRAAAAEERSERIVGPGQLGRLGDHQVPTVEQADTAGYFAWTEGRLVLDAVPLKEALPQLGRWFDLEFRLADTTLGSVPLSATLRTSPTPEVLDNLAASLDMRLKRQGRTVTLYSAEKGR
jgi:transmembrane sensor